MKAVATTRRAAAVVAAAAGVRVTVRSENLEPGTRNLKPRIAITEGDPAGIGPEIARRAAADVRVNAACEPRLYGPPDGRTFAPGVLSAEAGRAAYDAIVGAVEDAQACRVEGIATAPINKEAFRLSGLPWPGHTELLAHLTGSRHVAMMFHSEPLLHQLRNHMNHT